MPGYRKADKLLPSVLLGDMDKSRGGGSLENLYLEIQNGTFLHLNSFTQQQQLCGGAAF